MKKIYFDNMKNWIWIGILILSLVFAIVSTLDLFQLENSKLNNGLGTIGFLLLAVYLSKMFWYKNYVHSNKRGLITIRVNTFIGKTLKFREIEHVELNEKKLLINKKNGGIVVFDLEGIIESDIKKLYRLININTNANNVYN